MRGLTHRSGKRDEMIIPASEFQIERLKNEKKSEKAKGGHRGSSFRNVIVYIATN